MPHEDCCWLTMITDILATIKLPSHGTLFDEVCMLCIISPIQGLSVIGPNVAATSMMVILGGSDCLGLSLLLVRKNTCNDTRSNKCPFIPESMAKGSSAGFT